MRTDPDNRRPRRKACGGCCLVGVLLAAALAVYWWISANEMPIVTIPTPTPPNPNAFDTLNAAAAHLLDSDKIGYAITARHTSGLKIDREYRWSEKQKFVAENAPALALIRKSLIETYLNPPIRSNATLFPYLAKFRALARLLALESSVRAHRGNYAGAASSCLDAMEMGEQIPRGSVLIGGLVGMACQAIGRRPLSTVVDRLTAAEARTAVQRMERIRARHVPFADILQEEKWFGQATLMEMMRHANRNSGAAPNAGAPITPMDQSGLLSRLIYLFYSKRRILNDYTVMMDAEIARAKQPYGTPLPASVPSDPIAQVMIPVNSTARCAFARSDALTGLLELKIALRAYRIEHGSYPGSLDALAPSILPRLPADPFAKAGTFGYRRAGSSYVVYSVGPDGKDDGGKPIDTGVVSATNPNERYLVKPESKGDIVAGKNGW